MRKLRDVVTIDDLAKDLGVETLDRFADRIRASSSAYDEVYASERASGRSEVDAEMAAENAEALEMQTAIRRYAGAIVQVAENLYQRHGLQIVRGGSALRASDYKVVPIVSWEDAADKIRVTMNGVGIFHFDTLGDFLASGPYTARQATLAHLRTIVDWPLVRQGRRASRLVEEEMRG
jgi:hypothetical protein